MKSVHQLILLFNLVILLIVGGCSDNRKIDYQLQEQCGKQCEEYFKKNYLDKVGGHYKNHYNKQLNKCFILVFYDDGGPTEMLFDVNENKPVGYYTLYRVGKESCSMPSPSGNECKSRGDWDLMIKPYMEE